ncbi:hypothetical protein G6F40_015242 [Rhizopus arrhizus]|nr:hypothetical protein G6F40_015242 [Rhizopus arrhizus]
MRAERTGAHRHAHRRTAAAHAHQHHTIGTQRRSLALQACHGGIGLALGAEAHRGCRFQLRDFLGAGRRRRIDLHLGRVDRRAGTAQHHLGRTGTTGGGQQHGRQRGPTNVHGITPAGLVAIIGGPL